MGCRLPGLEPYPTLASQEERLTMAGWDAARATDMLQVFQVGQTKGDHCCRTHCCWGGERWVVLSSMRSSVPFDDSAVPFLCRRVLRSHGRACAFSSSSPAPVCVFCGSWRANRARAFGSISRERSCQQVLEKRPHHKRPHHFEDRGIVCLACALT